MWGLFGLYSKRVVSSRAYSTRPRVPPQLRRIVWEKYMPDPRLAYGPCLVCRTEIHITSFEIGHVQSRIDGGCNRLENLRPICTLCNRSMGRENLYEYKKRFFPE